MIRKLVFNSVYIYIKKIMYSVTMRSINIGLNHNMHSHTQMYK